MNWKYWVMRKMNPNRAKNATVTAPLAAEKAGTLNSETSSIGLSACRSRITNMTPTTTVPANPPTVRADSQPRPGASMIV